jgi:predicted ribosome quality control (RQC) complex YloA/Tae2 family protein
VQHLNYFGLAALAHELQPWIGATWVRSFSQQKDEWVGTLRDQRRVLHLRASCRSTLPYVVPEVQFRRARVNSVDLFPELIGKALTGIALVDLDRVLVCELSGGWSLAFKMYGNRSNLLLMNDGRVVNLFRRSLKEDFDWQPARPLRQPPVKLPPWTDEPLSSQMPDLEARLRKVYPVLDAVLCQAVIQRLEAGEELEVALAQVACQAQKPPFWLVEVGGTCQLHLLELPAQSSSVAFATFSEAVRGYVHRALSRGDYDQQHRRIDTLLHKLGRSLRLKADSLAQSLRKHERRRSDEELGHLIMANLHAIPPRAESVELYDFYRDQPVQLTLNPLLNAQENAARYYKRQRDREAKYLHQLEQQAATLELLEQLAVIEAEWAKVKDRESLRRFYRTYRAFLQEETLQQAAQLPFREFLCQGYRIWVGRNARSNDALTFRYARKQDGWFHAKDVSGSHVVLRREGSQNPPLAVVEYAAGLAAWFSKSRNESLVPVSMTERRYVRKSRHMAPGQVVLQREEVILIEPMAPVD